jgi:formate dehydrogenase accessory protein FdhD
MDFINNYTDEKIKKRGFVKVAFYSLKGKFASIDEKTFICLLNNYDRNQDYDRNQGKVALCMIYMNENNDLILGKEVESNFQVSVHELIDRIEELKDNAEIWQATGGTHVAGIVYKDHFIVKEDVSRHVAVDKVIGYGLLHDFDLSNSYVIYSGRMPADMVIKMTRVGVPILASNAAPANSGYNIAKKGNVTLVGFLRGERCNVYNNQNRVIFD